MKLFFLLIACIVNLSLMAQNDKYFNRYFNNYPSPNTNARSIVMDKDSTYFVSGDTRDLIFGWQACFLQINNKGETLQFIQTYDSTREATATQIVVTDSLIFGAGYENLPNTSSTYYIMAKKDGTLIQEGNVGDTLFVNSGYTACRAHDGGFLIGGEIQPYDPPNGQPTHPYLVKLDSAGNKLWDTIYYQYGEPYAWIESIIPAPDNGYYALGSTKSSLWLHSDILLMHIAEDGSVLWDKIITFGTPEFGKEVIYTNDGGFLITGYINDDAVPHGYKGLIIKLNAERDIEWINDTAYISGMPHKCSIEVADGFIFGGGKYKTAPPYDIDACVTKLNPDGSLAWQRTHDRAGEDDYTYDMLSTPDGSYLLCGRTESYDDTLGVYRADVLLLKVNCMGLQTLPQAMFINSSIDTNYLCVFQNLSEYTYPDSLDGGHYIWDFGDGTPPLQTTTDAFIPHYYPNFGTYRVSLTAIVCNDTSTYTQTLNLWATGIASPLPPPKEGQQVLPLEGGVRGGLCTVLPNPAQNQLMLYYQPTEQAEASLSIKNFAGSTIYQTTLSTAGSYRINTSTWAAGMYFCEISQPNAAPITQKVLIVK